MRSRAVPIFGDNSVLRHKFKKGICGIYRRLGGNRQRICEGSALGNNVCNSAEKLVGLLFPNIAPATTAVADAISLIQTAVLLVEQKFAAAGVQSGTGVQKLAEVLLLAAPAVTQTVDDDRRHGERNLSPESGLRSSGHSQRADDASLSPRHNDMTKFPYPVRSVRWRRRRPWELCTRGSLSQ